MNYTYLDLLCYLLIYAFLGWTIEVLIISVRDHELKNRGFFNLPFCLSYGVVMDILIVIIPTMEGRYFVEYLAAVAVSSVVTYLSGSLSKRVSRTRLWQYEENNLLSGEMRPFLFGLLQGGAFFLFVLLVHPLFFFLVNLTPDLLKSIVCLVILLLLAVDFIVITKTLRGHEMTGQMDEYMDRGIERKRRFGERVTSGVWHRIYQAYPGVIRMESEDRAVFAKGVCFDKLVWVFVFMSIGGCLFEVVFVWATTGILMSRSSLIYGPISIVWGFGGAFLTVVLQRLSGKEDRYVFFAGCLLGGIYEYTCSVISEVVFGTTFWDYSDMPFNIGGRTNLLFCLFWGIVSVWWMKWMYPHVSDLIEKIPPVPGKVITWVVLTLLVLDGLISGAALLRYVDRIENPVASNIFEQFLDLNYPSSMLETIWPNLQLTG